VAVGEPIAAKRGKYRAPDWSASILEAGPSVWAAQRTKFEGKYQIKKPNIKIGFDSTRLLLRFVHPFARV
jgi:hypothetical protein